MWTAATLAKLDIGALYVWKQTTLEGKAIILVLVVLSVFAWAVMASKAMEMRRARRLNDLFLGEFRGQKDVFAIFDRGVSVEGCPLFSVYQAGCAELDRRLRPAPELPRREQVSLKAMERVKRVIERVVAEESLRLESGLILLALAVSGAPFLGLLGTVWGVMNTFSGVAQAVAAGNRADLAAMAPGVSGALLTTVAGLLVAIPSMFGYNWLVHHLRVHTVELDNFAQELVSEMETEYLGESEEL
ncbi:MAG: MotA/TolQ/ExbB proton channel family protein [Verrucomicrobia bacterium]|nr:MotA/TolQ/ExbB proton channel family protein [Verrucomicrobiota bacterium]